MGFSFRYLGYAAGGVVFGVSIAGGCSAANDSPTTGTAAKGGTATDAKSDTSSGGSTTTGGTGAGGSGGLNLDGAVGDGKITPDAACELQKYQATVEKSPVDVIMIVDNSCSMSEEIQGIQTNINTNFAQVVSASGIDFRVVLIAEHGPASNDDSVCIDPPLAGGPCPIPVPANTPPINNPPVFYQFDNDDIESNDGWCKSLDWYLKSDRYGLAPNGWSQWLRKDAFKAFVMFTDDHVDCTWASGSPSSSCSSPGPKCYDDGSYSSSLNQSMATAAATQLDQDLMALDPIQFGSPGARNYIWYSVVGVTPNVNNPSKAYEPSDPLQAQDCTSAVNSSAGNQALSILTGGLRFPICDGLNFDVVFNKIAEGVIKIAKIQCEFPMPAPPEGKELDPASITIEFTPSTGGATQTFTQVSDITKCKPGSFYIGPSADGGTLPDGGSADKLKLCPETCTIVQSDKLAKIEILALCKTGPAI